MMISLINKHLEDAEILVREHAREQAAIIELCEVGRLLVCEMEDLQHQILQIRTILSDSLNQ